MDLKTALVIRATGVQGRGVTQHLTNAGWHVHALVKDLSEPRALQVEGMGAKLYLGNLGDTASVEAAMQGCSAVFLNQMPSFTDPEGEIREATSVLDLAKKLGIGHIVHSTTLGLNDPDVKEKLKGHVTEPAVMKKVAVEQLVRNSGISWTILRPGFFMTNFIGLSAAYMYPSLAEGKLLCSYTPDTIFPLIAPDDIGAFAAAAFQDPARFAGKIICPVGENLGIQDTVKTLGEASGRSIELVFRTDEEYEKVKANPMVAGQKLTVGLHELVDMAEVKNWNVPLTSFKTFLEAHKEELAPMQTPFH